MQEKDKYILLFEALKTGIAYNSKDRKEILENSKIIFDLLEHDFDFTELCARVKLYRENQLLIH